MRANTTPTCPLRRWMGDNWQEQEVIRAKLRRLRSEQFRKKGEDMIGSIGSNRAQAFDQADLVDRAELIKDNLSRLSLETNGYAGGIGTALGGHGGHDDGVDVPIHFIGGNDQTGAGLSDFSAFSGIEANEIDLEAADYQRHSSQSHWEEEDPSRSRSWSSPAWCIVAEGVLPPAARARQGAHHQLVPLDVDFHRAVEMALMEQRFRNTDAARVADADDLGFHERGPFDQCGYDVITMDIALLSRRGQGIRAERRLI